MADRKKSAPLALAAPSETTGLYDVEIEQALIGAFLVDNKTVPIAAAHVKPGEFYDPLHQQLVELIFEFEDEGKAVSPLTLNAWAKHWPGMVEIGGLHYLAGLAASAPAKPDVAAFAMIVAELAQRREAFTAVTDAADRLGTHQAIGTALEGVVSVSDRITASQLSAKTDTSAAEGAHQMLRQIEQQAVAPQQFGCRTMIDALDELIGALYPENLYIAGGRPGMGKSILACNFARVAAEQGYAVDFFSLEMPRREGVARVLCDIDYDRAIKERLKPLHYEDFVKMRATGPMVHRAAEANIILQGLGIDIFDQDRLTIAEISAISRARAAKDPRPRLIIIDHLHIVMPGDRYGGRRVDELSEITGAAKRLAKRVKAPVLLLSQLSREIEKRDDKHPFMADFRDSGSIEQDADVVMSLYRGAYYAERAVKQAKSEQQRTEAESEILRVKGVLEIEVLKQRSGNTGSISCFIDPASSVIRSHNPYANFRAPQTDIFAGGEPLNSVKT